MRKEFRIIKYQAILTARTLRMTAACTKALASVPAPFNLVAAAVIVKAHEPKIIKLRRIIFRLQNPGELVVPVKSFDDVLRGLNPNLKQEVEEILNQTKG